MIKWLLKKYISHKLKTHINKSHCFVIPILDKSELVDGKNYETFDFKMRYHSIGHKRSKYDIKTACWCEEKQCFLFYNHIETYEEFKPLRESFNLDTPIEYDILEYNPCDINELDIQEIKNITFNADDNTQSDDIWENLIKYFEDRGLFNE